MKENYKKLETKNATLNRKLAKMRVAARGQAKQSTTTSERKTTQKY